MAIHLTNKPKGIIFDCDGVIIDSFDSNTIFYNKLRHAVDLPDMTEEERHKVHMMTGIQAFELVIPEPLRKHALEGYNNVNYAKEIVPMLTIYEGLHDLLAYCKAQGILLGIHTNRIIAMQEILETHNLTGYYDPIITPADLPAKPDPIGSLTICKQWGIEPEEALFIGDSENDLKTATAANIPFIGFKNLRLKTKSIVNGFKDIQNWLEAFGK